MSFVFEHWKKYGKNTEKFTENFTEKNTENFFVFFSVFLYMDVAHIWLICNFNVGSVCDWIYIVLLKVVKKISQYLQS